MMTGQGKWSENKKNNTPYSQFLQDSTKTQYVGLKALSPDETSHLKYFSAAHINNTIRCMRFYWNSGSKQAFIWNCPLPCREWIEGEQSFTYKSEKQMMQFQNQTKFFFRLAYDRKTELHELISVLVFLHNLLHH